MKNNFIQSSKNLLLDFLYTPGGFSFFPSPIFWASNFEYSDLSDSLKHLVSFNLQEGKTTTLYIHIPFCDKICNYCNCFKKKLLLSEEIDRYIEYLEQEAKIYYNIIWKKIKISSIFIGGWTPNLLSISQFKQLHSIIVKYYDISGIEWFILDGHPNYYSREKLKYFSSIWVTRVTFAVQSFDNLVLEKANRESYSINQLHQLIQFASSVNIQVNIDLLIWLQWQTLDSIKNDFQLCSNLKVNNVSVHFMMLSDNMKYSLPSNYHELIKGTKILLQNIKLPYFSSNITEDHYASTKNTTLSLWAEAVTNIYSTSVFQKPKLKKYYQFLDDHKVPASRYIACNKRQEMKKYFYLNILHGVSIDGFFELFNESIYDVFWKEIKFLFLQKVTILKDNKIIPNRSDLEVLLHANILFLDVLQSHNFVPLRDKEISNYFLATWELIDK